VQGEREGDGEKRERDVEKKPPGPRRIY